MIRIGEQVNNIVQDLGLLNVRLLVDHTRQNDQWTDQKEEERVYRDERVGQVEGLVHAGRVRRLLLATAAHQSLQHQTCRRVLFLRLPNRTLLQQQGTLRAGRVSIVVTGATGAARILGHAVNDGRIQNGRRGSHGQTALHALVRAEDHAYDEEGAHGHDEKGQDGVEYHVHPVVERIEEALVGAVRRRGALYSPRVSSSRVTAVSGVTRRAKVTSGVRRKNALLVAEKHQVVRVGQGGEEQIERQDSIGRARLAVVLGERDEIGGDGALNGHRRQDERGQVREHVGEEGVDAADEERLLPHYKSRVREHHNVAEAEEQHEQVDNAQEEQVDEGGVPAHARPREHPHREQVAEQADHEQSGREEVRKARVIVVVVALLDYRVHLSVGGRCCCSCLLAYDVVVVLVRAEYWYVEVDLKYRRRCHYYYYYYYYYYQCCNATQSYFQ